MYFSPSFLRETTRVIGGISRSTEFNNRKELKWQRIATGFPQSDTLRIRSVCHPSEINYPFIFPWKAINAYSCHSRRSTINNQIIFHTLWNYPDSEEFSCETAIYTARRARTKASRARTYIKGHPPFPWSATIVINMVNAFAVLQSATAAILGYVSITQLPGDCGKAVIHANLTGVSPGRHGFHIHQYGDLSNGMLHAAWLWGW